MDSYEYPYHYVPCWDGEHFSQTHHWAWGFRYLGMMRAVFGLLPPFDSLLDVGCGDGRFLREVNQIRPDKRLLGLDVSGRAIRLASALNPGPNDFYMRSDIRKCSVGRFDVVTLLHVLEHIPLDEIDGFLEAVAKHTRKTLILTVPHANNPLQAEHFQHFTADELYFLLRRHFPRIDFTFLDPRSVVMAVLYRLIGGAGEHFVLTNGQLLGKFYQLYVDRYLYTRDEQNCGQIAAICQRNN